MRERVVVRVYSASVHEWHQKVFGEIAFDALG